MTRFHVDRNAMFDLKRTASLAELFATPGPRDDAWLDRFYDAAWFASMVLVSDDAFSGPDGMPYLRLELPREGEAFESQCLANLAGPCLERGAGAALFAAPGDPPEGGQFVFPLGGLDSMLRYDSPAGDPVDLADWARPPAPPPKRGFFGFGRAPEPAREVLSATPSADYLPPHAARALHHYLANRWELAEPRVQLLIDMQARPTRNLVIGRKRSTFRDEAFLQDLLRYTTWYLPPGRSIALMPEDWSLEQMTRLTELF
jgi:hypothetical protein